MGVQWIYNAVYPYFRGKRLDSFSRRFGLNGGPPAKVLDVGGCPTYWQYRELPLDITCLNLPSYQPPADLRGCKIIRGDGTSLPFPDSSFDIAHSNSVIEHVGTWENQKAFAREIRRVGRGVWVQTPAKYFPVECHTFEPFLHYLPNQYRKPILRNGTIWGLLTRPTPAEVDEFLASTRLLTFREMKELFPDCTIIVERFAGLPKSYIAFRPVTQEAAIAA